MRRIRLSASDFHAEISGMTAIEAGVHIKLIAHYAMHGYLRDDDAVLAGIAGMTVQRWSSVKPIIITKWVIVDGLWHYPPIYRQIIQRSARLLTATNNAFRKIDQMAPVWAVQLFRSFIELWPKELWGSVTRVFWYWERTCSEICPLSLHTAAERYIASGNWKRRPIRIISFLKSRLWREWLSQTEYKSAHDARWPTVLGMHLWFTPPRWSQYGDRAIVAAARQRWEQERRIILDKLAERYQIGAQQQRKEPSHHDNSNTISPNNANIHNTATAKQASTTI